MLQPASPDVETPQLTVDADVMDANLQAMADAARARGLALRPHAKTHKCLPIAAQQLALGAAGLTVATVGEAEVFAAAGFGNLFIAYPIWASGPKAGRLRALAHNGTVRVGADSVEGLELLARALAGTTAQVVVEVDSGQHRSGVRPEKAGEVAVAAQRLGLTVAGVFTFPGHGYAPAGRSQAAADEALALTAADAALRSAGIEAYVRSGGSTPTAAAALDSGTAADGARDGAGALNELRPGVYVFNDAQQVELGVAQWSDVALTVLSTVVSRSDRTVVLDAGSKVLGADRPVWATGFGRLPEHPQARIIALSEHHATVEFPADAVPPELGSVLRVAPNHVCAAVNLADEFVVVRGGVAVDVWPVAARGRNS